MLDKLYQFLSGVKPLLPSPENIVRSIPEMSLEPLVRKRIIDIHHIRNSSKEVYKYSLSLPLAFRTQMHFAERHIYKLSDVTVNVRTGACAVPGNFFQESYGSLRRCLIEKPFPLSPGRNLDVGGSVICVPVTGFYHFLLEEVPRLLWALEYCVNIGVVVHHSAPRYVFEVLDSLRKTGVLRSELVVLHDEVYSVKNYVFTQAEAYSGFVNSSDISITKKHLTASDSNKRNGEDNVYISRVKARRSFCNEEKIISFVKELGFEVYNLEDLSFDNQIHLFKNASVVVASHGAGLSNVLWCKPGTRVVEMFSPRCFNDCYARLCSQLGLLYVPLWAKETKGWGHVDLSEVEECLLKLKK